MGEGVLKPTLDVTTVHIVVRVVVLIAAAVVEILFVPVRVMPIVGVQSSAPAQGRPRMRCPFRVLF